ncbi:endo-1,4-beta-xylanase [Mucilaginibacter sp. BJC16-A38]|uniref:endo-1,4-beta-xylanase n=1 Tax=Mucilaginibacter phenanthrenivorans TaxID=1234842 RepID=UPI0021575D3C|nr:endo-1,4-beta-xylanase [Mucilaginibacter phenanthrenivorans]MCR8559739.1 endo-1,4-beta-xylanase [Mucilaginibacter phenanthrenivorans]
MKYTLKCIILLFLTFCFGHNLLFAANSLKKKHLSYKKPQNDTLKKAASFPIGVGIGTRELNDPKMRQLIAQEFSSISTASSIFWNQISPSPGVFLFGPADNLVNFALKNGLRVHGHCLVHFQGTPDWVQNFQGDSLAWENLFKTHIQTIVTHFKGRVSSWDVVNEAFDDDGIPRMADEDKAHNKKYVNIWALHLGKDYIARAFIYAHEADPNAILFYNDYAQERLPKRLQAIINMANNLKARHVPIGGLGLQMHINVRTSEAGIRNALTQVAKTGLQIRISELDIRVNPSNKIHDIDSLKNATTQASLFYSVAHDYKTIIPKNQQYGITFWCVTDGDSYINILTHNRDQPLLFDVNYNKKSSYKSFISGLKH